MQEIWREERMPEDWRNSVITPIYKEKGDIQDCGNYQGIKQMLHTKKIWEKITGAEQFGFMPGRSTMDAVFFPESPHGEMQRRTERITYGVLRPREGI